MALFLDRFPRLSETFISGQAAALLQAGVDLRIFADRPLASEQGGLVALDDDPVGRIDYRRTVPAARAASYLRAAAILAGCLPRRRLFPGRWAVWAARRSVSGQEGRLRPVFDLPSRAATHAYDAVVCHFGPMGSRAVHLRDLGGIHGPIATVFHGFDVSSWVCEHGVDVYADLFARGDCFLPVSDYWRRRLVELGCPDDRISVLHVGIDTKRLRFRAARCDAEGRLRVLSVARLVEKKGIEYGVRAIAELLSRGLDVEYRIVGDGPLRSRLERLCGELAVTDYVHFLGARSSSEVAALLDESDALLAPSVTAGNGDQEGIPVVLMEAMAVGVPVVSTRHSGIPELVRHAQTGLLTDERDVGGLVEALARLHGSLRLRASLATAVRETVTREYDVHVQARRLLDILGLHRARGTGTSC